MKKSKRLQEIFCKNAEFEKESPYNFCGRWCEQCIYEKQISCKVYLDELEQKMICVAYGKEPDDLEITEAVIKRQFEDVGEKIDQFIEENEIDIDAIDDPAFEKIREHIKFVENSPLQRTAERYLDITHEFLEKTFYKTGFEDQTLARDFETVSWYHTLLPVKLNRALAGFHEPACEDDLALYDTVAQFQICKKAITQSVEAFRKIGKSYASFRVQIQIMLALLHNIYNRIEKLEESIV